MLTSLPPSNVILIQWNVIEIIDTKQHHLVGFDTVEQLGRVSTPIMHFDAMLGTAETRSGSHYTLRGEPGKLHADAAYVLAHFYPIDVIAYRFIYPTK